MNALVVHMRTKLLADFKVKIATRMMQIKYDLLGWASDRIRTAGIIGLNH